MEQYPIPQFIEAEGKIAFFISFRQFFYLVGAGVIAFISYHLLPAILFYIISIIAFFVAAVLGFMTIDGTPILNFLLGSFGFSMRGKDYTWKKKETPYPFKPIRRTQIKKIDQGPVLQSQVSQLKKMHTQVELHMK